MRIIRSFTLIILIGIAMAGVVVNPAKSEVLRFSYQGFVTNINEQFGLLSFNGIVAGTTFFGEFEYDTLNQAAVVPETGTTVHPGTYL